jgi:hypothetical protein
MSPLAGVSVQHLPMDQDNVSWLAVAHYFAFLWREAPILAGPQVESTETLESWYWIRNALSKKRPAHF